MTDKPFKTTSIYNDTQKDLKAIARQLSEEKKLPVSLPRALKFIVDFYKEQHKDQP